MRIYVASSWRNEFQPNVVKVLREDGHEVYDFRDHGFSWSDVAPNWKDWTPDQYSKGLMHPLAVKGFARDMDALKWCDACVMVMPCGPAAAMEMGWACGARKEVAIWMPAIREPDLMVKMADLITTNFEQVRRWAKDKSVKYVPSEAMDY